MPIKTIEPIAVSLPMLKPVIMAGEEVRRADNVLVRIAADNGLVGWGEAASAPLMTGETLESIVSAVHYLAPALHGREAADIAGALAAMDGRMYGNHGAKAAIEIALHDLAGKAAGKPVHALLGDKQRSRLALLGVIGGGDFDGDLRDAAQKKAAGVTAYKIKVGIDTPGNGRRAHARDLPGAGQRHADLRRCQPGLTRDRRCALCARSRAAGLDFLEQPVAATISPAWRRSPRQRATSRSAPTRASIRSTTSGGISGEGRTRRQPQGDQARRHRAPVGGRACATRSACASISPARLANRASPAPPRCMPPRSFLTSPGG